MEQKSSLMELPSDVFLTATPSPLLRQALRLARKTDVVDGVSTIRLGYNHREASCNARLRHGSDASDAPAVDLSTIGNGVGARKSPTWIPYQVDTPAKVDGRPCSSGSKDRQLQAGKD
jgi:hypothetical protein